MVVLPDGDIDSFTGTGKERNLVETNLRVPCGKGILYRITGYEAFLESSVWVYVKYEGTLIFFEYVLVIAHHRSKAEPLSIVAFDAATDGDGIGLKPVGRQRIGISL